MPYRFAPPHGTLKVEPKRDPQNGAKIWPKNLQGGSKIWQGAVGPFFGSTFRGAKDGAKIWQGALAKWRGKRIRKLRQTQIDHLALEIHHKNNPRTFPRSFSRALGGTFSDRFFDSVFVSVFGSTFRILWQNFGSTLRVHP